MQTSSKQVFFQVAQCRKTQKEAIQAHSTFSTNRKLQKNARGYPLIKFENFRKKSHSAEKNPKGGPFGLTCCTFGSIKKFMVYCENRTHALRLGRR